MTNSQLIKLAASVVMPKKVGDRLMGDVGAAVISAKGKTYTGVCADTAGTGICAEVAALGTMMTQGEYRFQKIVAVWKDKNKKVFVIHPCGKCREFFRQLDLENMDADVLVGPSQVKKLKELLPYKNDFCPVN